MLQQQSNNNCEMKKAANRLWDWLFHPSVRPYYHPNLKASTYRYPSPGNSENSPVAGQDYVDYKTPFEHNNKYNVRYANPTPAQKADPIEEVKLDLADPLVKLKRVGLLGPGKQNNVDAVAAATKKYKQKYGFSVDQNRIFIETYNGLQENLLQSKHREDISAYVQSFYQDLRIVKKTSQDYNIDRKTIDDPETVPLESYDLFVSPHFQQGRINNEYLIERDIDENTKKGYINSHVGDAKFWKAVDNTLDSSEIEKVQRQINDAEPNNFELKGKVKVELQLDSKGNVVDVHPNR